MVNSSSPLSFAQLLLLQVLGMMPSVAIVVRAFSPPVFSSIPMNYWHEQQQQQQQIAGFLPSKTVEAEETATAKQTSTIRPATTIKTTKVSTTQNDQPNAKSKRQKVIKFYVEEISSMQELRYFLEEDERPTIIKFYAKWCKKCQRVGKQMDRLAMEYGDRLIPDSEQRQVFVDGDARFAQIEFTPESQSFVTDTLGIRGTPTMHMYVGTKKLLDGGSSIESIRDELRLCVQTLDHQQLRDRADAADDGVFASVVDESFYDSPDFLNEEW